MSEHDDIHAKAVIATIYEAITSILEPYTYADRDYIIACVKNWHQHKDGGSHDR